MHLNLDTPDADELARVRDLVASLESMLEDHRASIVKLGDWPEQDASYLKRLAEAGADIERLEREASG